MTPDIDCATPAVYGALGLAPSTDQELGAASAQHGRNAAQALLGAPLLAARSQMRNDLERPAAAAFPGLAAWREMLDELGLDHFRLAGSGSSFFGLFDVGSGEAQAAVERVQDAAGARGLGLRFSGAVESAAPGSLVHVQRTEVQR